MANLECFYEYAAVVPRAVDVRRADGRRASQVCMALLAPSVAAAIRVVNTPGWGRSYIGKYVQVSDADDAPNGVPLADYPPGTVLIAPLDPGDTIDGTTGWRPYPAGLL
jgi:hypothetical protein